MKKIISFVLAISFVLTLAPFAGVFSFALESRKNSQNSGEIEISTAEDFKKLADKLDAKAVLTKDIEITDKSFTPIGSTDKPFTGIFDGNGHSVTYNISISKKAEKGFDVGLFGCVSGGQIKRLTVKGSITAAVGSANIGAVAARLTNGAKVFDCRSYVDMEIDSAFASGIGAFVGTVIKSSVYVERDASLVRCVNNGKIKAKVTDKGAADGSALSRGTSGALGGILGFVADGVSAELNKCINNGVITVTGGKYNIGGIVGQTSTDSATSAVYITECANKGDITVYKLTGERAAGIIAYVKSGNIDYSYNLGNIIAYSDNGNRVSTSGYGTYYGIFGYANLGSANKLSVTYCYSASEKELEAEICTVRNPSYGTFANYFMKGRSEYETALNSNAAAGKAGKSFESAEQLTQMITADCGKYAENKGGYPILSWESDCVLGTEKENSLYVSLREREDDFDIRFVVHCKQENKGSKLTVAFTMADGSIKSISGELGNEVPAYRRIFADNAPYVPASGYSIFALCEQGMEYGSWKLAKVTLSEGQSVIMDKEIKYTDLFEEAAPAKLPFADLPDFPEGKVSPIYNAGPGLYNDQNSSNDSDSQMVIISSVKGASFKSYVKTLENAGYTESFSNEAGRNYYHSFQKEGKSFYIYYTASMKQARIIYDRSSNVLLSELESVNTSGKNAEFYQYAIDYTKGTGQTSGRDKWAIDCGMCYIVKLPDNSVIMIDGGHERQTSNSAMEALDAFLHDITATPENGKVRIAGWFFSHAHGDHVFLAHRFLELYHEKYQLEAVLMNIPSYQKMSGGYDAGTFKMKDTVNKYYPEVKDIKLHTGQKLSLQGAEIEVVYTHEDAVNASTASTQLSNFNDSSTVIKLTVNNKSVMLLGDIDGAAEGIICSSISNEVLKSDAVQLSHHCFNTLTNLYPKIAAPLLLCPNSVENTNGNSAKRQIAIDAAGKEYRGILYAGSHTSRLTFDGEQIEYENLAPYWDGFFVNYPASLGNFNGAQLAENPLDISVLSGMNDISSLVYDKSANGTMGANANEAAQALFDGQTSTKWCVTESKVSHVTFKTKTAVTVCAYQLFAGNDTQKNPGRNPKCWTLYGSLDGVTWEIIDSVYDGNMSSDNYSANTYLAENEGLYQFFTLVVHESEDAGLKMQISEIKLYSEDR